MSNDVNQYQLISFLKYISHSILVEPFDLKFAENEIGNVRGFSEIEETTRTYRFIPITEVLSKLLFHHEALLQLCLSNDRFFKNLSSRGIFLTNQSNGKLNLEKANVIKEFNSVIECEGNVVVHFTLQLYFDELETAIPIGSRAATHKICCFYGA